MSLAPFVRILGRGPARSRSLTRDEAYTAMRIILNGDAPPEAVGALLMLMRFRGETAPEVAGIVDALRDDLGEWGALPVAVDWPSYAAGRSRGAPYFLLAAKLVAQAGHPVLLHGWNSHQNEVASVRSALPSLGISEVTSVRAARSALETTGIAYLPAQNLHAPALKLLQLRDDLGLRSCLNTVFRMLNPSHAPLMLQGVFHPSYRDLQVDAGALLGQNTMGVIKGGGGEFERHPAKEVTLFGRSDGARFEAAWPAETAETRRLHDPDLPLPSPAALWSGRETDPFAESCVLGTAAMALSLLHKTSQSYAQAQAVGLWQSRDREITPTEAAL